MKKLFSLLTLLLTTQLAWSQQNSFFTHYSSEDGLSQNTVMSMLQDHKGNLWFATWDGINRFDGYAFKSYKARQGSFISLTNNRVDHLYEDKYGFLWLLTYDNRAHRFDPRTETFEQVPAAGEEGSRANILDIQVLANGTVWLFTDNNGAIRVLNKKDKIVTHLYSDHSGRFPANKFHSVYLDREGNEWMLTNNGLGFIRNGNIEFLSYFVERGNEQLTNPQPFYTVHENEDELFFGSDKGRIWRYRKGDSHFDLLKLSTTSSIISIDSVSPTMLVISTSTDGFFTYQFLANKAVHYSHTIYKDLSSKPILSTYVDKSSEVWFEQKEPGIVVHFNPFTGVLKREQIPVEPTNIDRARPAFHIHEDVHGTLWVHPHGGGFSSFDRAENRLVPFYNEIGNQNWKFSNKIHSSFSDSQGNLWLCTHSKGLEKITFRSVSFSMLTPTSSDYESLSNEVRALCEDNEQNLWVGLKDGMLRIYDRDRIYKGFLTTDGRIAKSGTPMEGNVYFILRDSKGVMWLATKGNGLVRAEPVSSMKSRYHLTRYNYNADDVYSLSNDNVYCVHEDHYGRIWVATFANGINYISKDEQGRTVFINHRNLLKGYPIDLCYKTRFITSDNNGKLWVGTTSGAVAFSEQFKDPKKIQFHHFSRKPEDVKSLSNNDVHWIVATQNKELYLATFGGGLNKLVSIDDKGNGAFKSYSVLDGLPSDVLLAIREDNKQNLWISTENGISKFTPSTESFDNYDDRSITFRVRFSEAASMMTAANQLMFGTSSGVFFFHPDSIKKSSYTPAIVFPKLSISNEEVLPAEGSVLTTVLDDTEELVLSHRENIIAIQYVALDYTNPHNIQYAYKLDGFESQWTMAEKLHVATYTNLPKGEYTFMVRSTNSDGVWVENTRTLDIVVLPSFWETPLAYFLYILFVVFIILVTVYILFTIYRLKHEVYVEQQMSGIKLRFFTNISHELRTPLTLIAGPVENVLLNENLPKEARDQLLVVERNTTRMLRLVNQILDFRKIQNKKMKMKVEQIELVHFVHKIMDNFELMAADLDLDFSLQAEESPIYLWVDADKFEKIVFNLLSNAFKYTPTGKSILVFIREKEKNISVGIKDEGIGIAESRIKTLFNRFENLVDRSVFNQESTGIGLSLVKELVEMHKAVIHVDSKVGVGSYFQVDFQKGRSHYDDTVEFILDDTLSHRVSHSLPADPSYHRTALQEPKLDVAEQKQSESFAVGAKEVMLLVEDNDELRSFLRSVFLQDYIVIEAVDGQDGCVKAIQFQPDIIISDLMMPHKDGLELMKELHSDMATSHIPIILLTAKTATENKIEGLASGADDYITKPFSARYLKARVENLLEQRRKLQHFYRTQLLDNSETISNAPAEIKCLDVEREDTLPEMSSIDRVFMDKLVELMEMNMDNGELVVDDFVQELAVSRSVFFKKLKTLTGLAPVEFIKEMRIKRAAQLIDKGGFNMTQISYMVGINDPRYFSKCFKAKFGITPTEYKERLKEKE